MNKYFRFKEKISILPGGELSVPPTSVDIGLPAVQSLELEGFFPSLALFSFMLFVFRF